MRAYKCDVCGKVYDRYPINPGYFDNMEYVGTNILTQKCRAVGLKSDYEYEYEPIEKKTYELCTDCCIAFNLWLESRKGANNEEESRQD